MDISKNQWRSTGGVACRRLTNVIIIASSPTLQILEMVYNIVVFKLQPNGHSMSSLLGLSGCFQAKDYNSW